MKKNTINFLIGLSGIILFFSTVGLIAGKIIEGIISGNTGVTDTTLGSWWVILLIAMIAISAVSTGFFIVIKIKNAKNHQEKPLQIKVPKIFQKKVMWTLMSIFFSLLLAIVLVGGTIANSFKQTINSELGLLGSKMEVIETDEVVDTEYYKSDYVQTNSDGSPRYIIDEETGYIHQKYSNTKLYEASKPVARQVQAEGTTILWNQDKDEVLGLPLAPTNKISLFSYASAHIFYSGTGSAQTYGYTPDFYSVLTNPTFGGFQVNKTLYNFYASTSITEKYAGVNNEKVNEVPWGEVNSAAGSTFSNYGDAAIIVIGRASGENADLFMTGADTIGGDYLELHANEKVLIEKVIALKQSGTFKKVILLLNTPTSFNLDIIKDYKDSINACLWIGQPGGEGLYAVAQILSGRVAPSGHLANVFPYNNMSAPATVNGIATTWTNTSSFNLSGRELEYKGHTMAYLENIYVGYKYYETRYEDIVMQANAGQKTAKTTAGVVCSLGEWDYNQEVAYPFGYGLSYTTFEYKDFALKKVKDGYEVTLTVKNTGLVSGQDAVQVYIQKPYTEYDKNMGIEQSAVNLCGYYKTKLIQPGKTESVNIFVSDESFKTYDSYGQKTYIVEKGNYYITAASDSHSAVNNILAKKGYTPDNTNGEMDAQGDSGLAELIKIDNNDYTTYSVSSATGYKITNRFDQANWNLYKNKTSNVVYMSRSNWGATYPTKARFALSKAILEDLAYEHAYTTNPDDVMPVYEQQNNLKLIDLKGRDYDDEYWDLLLNQMSLLEQSTLCATAYHGTTLIESISKPADYVENGALGVISRWGKFQDDLEGSFGMQFPANSLLAATFNDDLAKEVGRFIGENMLHTHRNGLYAPSINIQRTAYGGRNFEYYSEDPFISASMACVQTEAIQEKGNYVTIKHFALNDLETNRHGVGIWANEQSIREVYLSAFEKSVTKGHAKSCMSSFTRVGTYWCGASKDLMTEVLRNEWGFDGYTVSDCSWRDYMGMIDGVLAGNDSILYNNPADSYVKDASQSATVALALRESCHRILYVVVNSNAMNGVSQNVRFVPIVNWWQIAIMVAQGVCAFFTVICIGMAITSFILCAKNKNN